MPGKTLEWTESSAIEFLQSKDWYVSKDGTLHSPSGITYEERSAALYLCHEWDMEWA